MPLATDRIPAPTQDAALHATAAANATQPTVYFVRGRPGPLDRPALPSGHPESWGVITQGTILDQSIYPFPVFSDLPQ